MPERTENTTPGFTVYDEKSPQRNKELHDRNFIMPHWAKLPRPTHNLDTVIHITGFCSHSWQ